MHFRIISKKENPTHTHDPPYMHINMMAFYLNVYTPEKQKIISANFISRAKSETSRFTGFCVHATSVGRRG